MTYYKDALKLEPFEKLPVTFLPVLYFLRYFPNIFVFVFWGSCSVGLWIPLRFFPSFCTVFFWGVGLFFSRVFLVCLCAVVVVGVCWGGGGGGLGGFGVHCPIFSVVLI